MSFNSTKFDDKVDEFAGRDECKEKGHFQDSEKLVLLKKILPACLDDGSWWWCGDVSGGGDGGVGGAGAGGGCEHSLTRIMQSYSQCTLHNSSQNQGKDIQLECNETCMLGK